MATRKLYRSNYGEIFGVCKGCAQWRDLPDGGVRLVVILIAVFTENAALQVEKGNKAAGARARKASLELEKAMKEFRKVSIAASK